MTMITSNLKSLYPDTTFHNPVGVPDLLIVNPTICTVAGNIEGDAPSVRVPYVKTAPTPGFVAEGAEIDEDAPVLDEVLIHTGKLATLATISREAVVNQPGGSHMLADSQTAALTKAANTAFTSNPATPGTPLGLLGTAGLVSAGAVTDSLDAIADAITAVEVAGGHATGILLDPASVGLLRKMKDSTGSARNLVPIDAGSDGLRLYGVPVTPTPAMTTGTGLVVDSANIVAAVGQIHLDKSKEAAFSSDSWVYRLTLRIGWQVLDPTRISKFTVTAPTGD